jgi:hypothetical protein
LVLITTLLIYPYGLGALRETPAYMDKLAAYCSIYNNEFKKTVVHKRLRGYNVFICKQDIFRLRPVDFLGRIY